MNTRFGLKLEIVKRNLTTGQLSSGLFYLQVKIGDLMFIIIYHTQ